MHIINRECRLGGCLLLFKKKIVGLISLSVGFGMLLAIIVPTWTGVVAIVLVLAGAWNLFLC